MSRHRRSSLKDIISERLIDVVFFVILVIKGIFALLEVLGGIVFFIVPLDWIVRLVEGLTRQELTEDPHDVIAHYFLGLARSFSVSSQHFLAVYIFAHGAIQAWLIFGLIRKKLWYYPVSIVVFILFIAYQTYQYTYTHALWLWVLTVIDLFVIILTWHEYRFLRRKTKRTE